jgi:hypothetical protein
LAHAGRQWQAAASAVKAVGRNGEWRSARLERIPLCLPIANASFLGFRFSNQLRDIVWASNAACFAFFPNPPKCIAFSGRDRGAFIF